MRTQLSRFVEPDLEIIADYIAQDNPSRAVTFIRELRDKFREIGEDARIAVVGQYVILFRITDRVVRIERVVFGGRNLPSFFR